MDSVRKSRTSRAHTRTQESAVGQAHFYKELDNPGPCFIKGQEYKRELNKRNQKANIDTRSSQDLARNIFLKVIKRIWKETQAAGTELWDQSNKRRELEQKLWREMSTVLKNAFLRQVSWWKDFFFFLTNMPIFDSALIWNISKSLSNSTSLKLFLQSYTLRDGKVLRLRGIPCLWNFHRYEKDKQKSWPPQLISLVV